MNEELSNWNSTSEEEPYQRDCAYTDWLKPQSSQNLIQWILSPISSTGLSVFTVTVKGYVYRNDSSASVYVVSPALYLKPNVEITGDNVDGSKEHPYELQLS